MHKLERHFTRGGQTARVRSTHAEWQGRGGGPGGERYYQQHTPILYPTVGARGRLLLSSHCGSGGLWCWRLPAPLAGRLGGRRLEREVSVGRAAGWGPGLLAARFVPEPDAHGRDEGSPLATAIFRQEEGHVTLWRQFLHSLVHDSGEAKKREETGR